MNSIIRQKIASKLPNLGKSVTRKMSDISKENVTEADKIVEAINKLTNKISFSTAILACSALSIQLTIMSK